MFAAAVLAGQNFRVRCGACGNGDPKKPSHISFQTWRNCVRLFRRRNGVAPSFMIGARRRVWIAVWTRFPREWSSVSQTRCRVTRGNAACPGQGSLKKATALFKTVDCVLTIQNLVQKFGYMCFRSVQIQLDFIRHLLFRFNGDVQRDNLQLKIVDFFRICRGMRWLRFPSHFCDFLSQLPPFLCQFFDLSREFHVPLGICIVGQSSREFGFPVEFGTLLNIRLQSFVQFRLRVFCHTKRLDSNEDNPESCQILLVELRLQNTTEIPEQCAAAS